MTEHLEDVDGADDHRSLVGNFLQGLVDFQLSVHSHTVKLATVLDTAFYDSVDAVMSVYHGGSSLEEDESQPEPKPTLWSIALSRLGLDDTLINSSSGDYIYVVALLVTLILFSITTFLLLRSRRRRYQLELAEKKDMLENYYKTLKNRSQEDAGRSTDGPLVTADTDTQRLARSPEPSATCSSCDRSSPLEEAKSSEVITKPQIPDSMSRTVNFYKPELWAAGQNKSIPTSAVQKPKTVGLKAKTAPECGNCLPLRVVPPEPRPKRPKHPAPPSSTFRSPGQERGTGGGRGRRTHYISACRPETAQTLKSTPRTISTRKDKKSGLVMKIGDSPPCLWCPLPHSKHLEKTFSTVKANKVPICYKLKRRPSIFERRHEGSYKTITSWPTPLASVDAKHLKYPKKIQKSAPFKLDESNKSFVTCQVMPRARLEKETKKSPKRKKLKRIKISSTSPGYSRNPLTKSGEVLRRRKSAFEMPTLHDVPASSDNRKQVEGEIRKEEKANVDIESSSFRIRKTETPLMSSLYGQGAFSSYTKKPLPTAGYEMEGIVGHNPIEVQNNWTENIPEQPYIYQMGSKDIELNGNRDNTPGNVTYLDSGQCLYGPLGNTGNHNPKFLDAQHHVTDTNINSWWDRCSFFEGMNGRKYQGDSMAGTGKSRTPYDADRRVDDSRFIPNTTLNWSNYSHQTCERDLRSSNKCNLLEQFANKKGTKSTYIHDSGVRFQLSPTMIKRRQASPKFHRLGVVDKAAQTGMDRAVLREVSRKRNSTSWNAHLKKYLSPNYKYIAAVRGKEFDASSNPSKRDRDRSVISTTAVKRHSSKDVIGKEMKNTLCPTDTGNDQSISKVWNTEEGGISSSCEENITEYRRHFACDATQKKSKPQFACHPQMRERDHTVLHNGGQDRNAEGTIGRWFLETCSKDNARVVSDIDENGDKLRNDHFNARHEDVQLGNFLTYGRPKSGVTRMAGGRWDRSAEADTRTIPPGEEVFVRHVHDPVGEYNLPQPKILSVRQMLSRLTNMTKDKPTLTCMDQERRLPSQNSQLDNDNAKANSIAKDRRVYHKWRKMKSQRHEPYKSSLAGTLSSTSPSSYSPKKNKNNCSPSMKGRFLLWPQIDLPHFEQAPYLANPAPSDRPGYDCQTNPASDHREAMAPKYQHAQRETDKCIHSEIDLSRHKATGNVYKVTCSHSTHEKEEEDDLQNIAVNDREGPKLAVGNERVQRENDRKFQDDNREGEKGRPHVRKLCIKNKSATKVKNIKIVRCKYRGKRSQHHLKPDGNYRAIPATNSSLESEGKHMPNQQVKPLDNSPSCHKLSENKKGSTGTPGCEWSDRHQNKITACDAQHVHSECGIISRGISIAIQTSPSLRRDDVFARHLVYPRKSRLLKLAREKALLMRASKSVTKRFKYNAYKPNDRRPVVPTAVCKEPHPQQDILFLKDSLKVPALAFETDVGVLGKSSQMLDCGRQERKRRELAIKHVDSIPSELPKLSENGLTMSTRDVTQGVLLDAEGMQVKAKGVSAVVTSSSNTLDDSNDAHGYIQPLPGKTKRQSCIKYDLPEPGSSGKLNLRSDHLHDNSTWLNERHVRIHGNQKTVLTNLDSEPPSEKRSKTPQCMEFPEVGAGRWEHLSATTVDLADETANVTATVANRPYIGGPESTYFLRPVWRNARVDEIDRRVERALQLRRQMQESKGTANESCVRQHQEVRITKEEYMPKTEMLCPSDTDNVITSELDQTVGSGNDADEVGQGYAATATATATAPQTQSSDSTGNINTETKHETGTKVASQKIHREEKLHNYHDFKDFRQVNKAKSTISENQRSTELSADDRYSPRNSQRGTGQEKTRDVTEIEGTSQREEFKGIENSGNYRVERSLSCHEEQVSQVTTRPERPSSEQTSSRPSHSGHNSLKRLGRKNKNSPPTKISKMENTAFSRNPKLVGEFVQSLPHVPLSSFVEWFIETSDPNNFLGSENSSSSSDKWGRRGYACLHPGADSSTGVPTSSRHTDGESTLRSQPTSQNTKGSEKSLTPSRFTTETSVDHQLTPFQRTVPGEITSSGRQDLSFFTKENSWWERRRNSVTPTKIPLETSERTISSLEQSNKIEETTCNRSVQRKSFHCSPCSVKPGQCEVEGSDEGERSLRDFQKDREQLRRNLLYLMSGGVPSSGSVQQRRQQEDINKSESATDSGQQQPQPVEPRPNHMCASLKSLAARQAERDNCSSPTADSEREEPNTYNVSNKAGVSPPAAGDEERVTTTSSGERCAPGIRHILMKLRNANDQDAVPAVPAQPDRMRITLRRSSDVTGIIAKFQSERV